MTYLTPRQRRAGVSQGTSASVSSGEYLTPRQRRVAQTPAAQPIQQIPAYQSITKQHTLEQPSTKTPLDSSRYNIVGSGLLPRYKEDKPAAAIGKDIVNYGLGTIGRIFGAPSQAMMQASRAGVNALTGQKQDFSEMSIAKDVLHTDPNSVLGMVGSMVLDPTTYIGGGIVSDLSRAGIVGKGAKVGTAENLAANAARGQKATKNIPLTPQTATKQYLALERKANQPSTKTPNIIYATDKGMATDNINLPALPAGKPEPIRQPLQLPAPQQVITLPERVTSKIEAGAITTPARQSFPADIYVDQYGHASTNPDVFPTNQLRLPAPKRVGTVTIENGQVKYSVPMNQRTVIKRTVDTPNMITPKEAKKLGLDIRKMGRQISAGEYRGIGQTDYVQSPVPYTETPSIYSQGVRRETPFMAARGETPLGGTAPRITNIGYSQGVGRIERPNAVRPGELPRVQPPKVELPKVGAPKVGTARTKEPTIPVGQKERGYAETLRTDKTIAPEMRQNLTEQPLTYDPITNKDTFAKAQAEMNAGVDNAERKFHQVDMAKKYKPEDTVLGEMLIRHYSDAGDINKARELAGELAEKLTEAGQFIQAAKILRPSADPEAMVVYVKRQINKINTEGATKFGNKWNKIDLTDDEMKLINSMKGKTDAEIQRIQKTLYEGIAQRLPATAMDKINAWRRMAMLFNPLSQIRNIGGNVLMMGARKAADSVAAIVEKTLPMEKRTKSIGWSLDKDLRNAVDADWEANKAALTGNTERWSLGQVMGREKRVFKNNILEAIKKATGGMLNAEDVPFLGRAYRDALGGFMKARGMKEVTQEARDYATRRALEATYRDLNKFSELMMNLRNKTGVLGEAAIPFAKTPANIAVRAVEYSPAGIIQTLGSAINQVRKGTFNASRFIEQLSKGVSGTVGLTGLGFGLASLGIITGAPDSDKDKAAFDRATGKFPYAIHIGNKYFTYDWAQPLAIPLATGAEIYNSVKDKQGVFDTIYNGFIAGGDTLFNMSLLQNIKKLLGGAYSSPTEALAQTLGQYPKQAVPSLGGQFARIIDPTERDITGKNYLDTLKNYALSRTPGLSQKLPAKVDIRGNEVTHPGLLNRIASNMLTPWRSSEQNLTPVDTEINRLYQQTGEKTMFPTVAARKFTWSKNGQTYELTGQEYAQFQKTLGQETYKNMGQLMNSPDYQKLSDADKVKALSSVISDAKQAAQYEILKGRGLASVPEIMNVPTSFTHNKVTKEMTFAQQNELADKINKYKKLYSLNKNMTKEQVEKVAKDRAYAEMKAKLFRP